MSGRPNTPHCVVRTIARARYKPIQRYYHFSLWLWRFQPRLLLYAAMDLSVWLSFELAFVPRAYIYILVRICGAASRTSEQKHGIFFFGTVNQRRCRRLLVVLIVVFGTTYMFTILAIDQLIAVNRKLEFPAFQRQNTWPSADPPK